MIVVHVLTLRRRTLPNDGLLTDSEGIHAIGRSRPYVVVAGLPRQTLPSWKLIEVEVIVLVEAGRIVIRQAAMVGLSTH